MLLKDELRREKELRKKLEAEVKFLSFVTLFLPSLLVENKNSRMDFFIFCYLMKIQTTKDDLEEMKKEQDSLIAIFSEDRDRRDKEEEDLRNKLEVLFSLVQNQLNSLKHSLIFMNLK